MYRTEVRGMRGAEALGCFITLKVHRAKNLVTYELYAMSLLSADLHPCQHVPPGIEHEGGLRIKKAYSDIIHFSRELYEAKTFANGA
jgi:hypothetical protein